MRFSNLLILSYLFSSGLHATCQGSLTDKLPCRNKFYQNLPPFDNDLIHFKKGLLQKGEELLQNKEFQGILSELQNSQPRTLDNGAQDKCLLLDGSPVQESQSQTPTKTRMMLERAHLYIFISFSLSEKALLNIAHEAKQFGATLVLRGFREGSYGKTAIALQEIIAKTGQGVLIDPEVYTLFNITAVPTFVMAKPFQLYAQERVQTPIHDKLQGHMSAHYALETFAKEGDLREDARSLLNGRGK